MGNPDSPEMIMVESDDNTPRQYFRIGENLDSALRHLRYKDKSRTLWVDAICIDQDNTAEKAKQIKRMGMLYAAASRVIAWLGAEENDSKIAIGALRYLGLQIVDTVDRRLLLSPEAAGNGWVSPDVDLVCPDEVLGESLILPI